MSLNDVLNIEVCNDRCSLRLGMKMLLSLDKEIGEDVA